MIKNVIALKSIAWFFFGVSVIMASGCTGVYKISEKDYSADGTLSTSELAHYRNASMFVHLADKVVQIKSPIFSDEDNTISGEVIPINAVEYARYELANKKGKPTSKQNSPGYHVQQIHFFVTEYNETVSEDSTRVVSFTKEDVLETQLLKDVKGSGTIGTIVVVAGVAIVGLFVILLLACNCPHVYAINGSAHTKLNNAFVGSLSKVLESADYIALPESSSEQHSLAIVNATKDEVQYLNKAALLTIKHDKNLKILNDQEGNFYTLDEREQRLSNHTSLAYTKDNQSLKFTKLNESDLSQQFVTFPSKGIDNAKLVLSLKNTSWASFVAQEWYGLFGNKIESYRDKMAKRSKEDLINWRKEQGILLDVYLKIGEEWQYQSSIDLIGSTMYKDLVVPIKNMPANCENVEIKFVSGYNLWEIDYACMDFSASRDIKISASQPVSWESTFSNTQKEALTNLDEVYAELEYGDTLRLEFPNQKESDNSAITHFVSLSGYYQTQVNQEHSINRKELYSFRKPAQMSRYSYHLMKELSQSLCAND